MTQPPDEISKVDMKSNSRNIRIYIMSWNLAVRKLFDEHKERLKEKIPKDCDIYVFGLQECVDPDPFKIFEDIIPHCKEYNLKSARLFGRGDRSFISPKVILI